MYKVLPQMHRLASQVCEFYGVEIEDVVIDSENVGAEGLHIPYYILKLKDNPFGWRYLSCRPLKGRYIDFSKSDNNVTVVVMDRATYYDCHREVLPSWRGHLLFPNELHAHRHHISAGFMLVKPYADFVEISIIEKYEKEHGH